MDIDQAADGMPNELNQFDSVPTFMVFRDGKKIETFSGADEKKLKEVVDELEKESGEKAKATTDDDQKHEKNETIKKLVEKTN